MTSPPTGEGSGAIIPTLVALALVVVALAIAAVLTFGR